LEGGTRLYPDKKQITVLVAGADQGELQQICLNHGWNTRTANTCKGALYVIENETIPVVVCEANLPGGGWKLFLGLPFEQRPRIIAVGPAYDARLLGEVINLGGHDVLSQPYNWDEVHRVIEAASRNWHEHHSGAAKTLKAVD
jgi:DNA-binding response OmpR family regulator